MKKLLLLLTIGVFVWTAFAGYTWENDWDKIYTKDQNQVIDTNWLDDPLNAWTHSAVEWADGIVNADVTTEDSKQENMIAYISKWVNYFLGLLWMIVIIFIIKDGIVIITSAWDENKQKEAFINLKNYIIAIILIWVAYLIVNLIFWFVNTNTVN